jgi:hypothetical protein
MESLKGRSYYPCDVTPNSCQSADRKKENKQKRDLKNASKEAFISCETDTDRGVLYPP